MPAKPPGTQVGLSRQMARMRRFLKFSLFIILVDLFILLFLEGGMRVFHLGEPIASFLEEKSPDGDVWVTYQGNSIQPGFPREKPADTLRIFCFGGSTMLGFPYHPRCSFMRIFEWMVNESAPGQSLEVINLAKLGADSKDVLRLMESSLSYHPDLIVLYTGQNEFLRFSLLSETGHPGLVSAREFLARHCRIYQALVKFSEKAVAAFPVMIAREQGLLPFLGRLVPEDQGDGMPRPSRKTWRDEKQRVFAGNLEKIFELALQNHVPLIAFNLAVNLRDWPPLPEPVPEGLSQSQEHDLASALKQAEAFLERGNPQAAVRLLEDMEAQAPDYALIKFLLGRAMSRQGNTDEALACFEKSQALEQDQHRAPPSFNRIISRLAGERGIPLINPGDIFKGVAHGAPGFEFFEDHCHPNLKGQVLIARALYEKLRELEIIRTPAYTSPWPFPHDEIEVRIKRDFGLTREFLRERKLWLAIYYALNRALPGRDHKTIATFTEVINADPLDPLPRICLALIHLRQNREALALEQWNELMKESPWNFRKCIKHYFSPSMDLRAGVLMARIPHERDGPPLAGMILVRKPSETGEPEETAWIPLSEFNRFWRWSEGSWKDITAELQNRLEQRALKLSKLDKEPVPYDLRKNYGQSTFVTHDLVQISSSEIEACFQMQGADPFLVLDPVRLDHLIIKECEIQACLAPDTESGNSLAHLYWATQSAPDFSESRKMSFIMKPDGRFHTCRLLLGENPDWVLSDTIMRLRLDPADSPGEFCLKEMIFRPYSRQEQN